MVECTTTLSPVTKPGPDVTEHGISLGGKLARGKVILPAGLKGEVGLTGVQPFGFRQMPGLPGGSSRNSVSNDEGCIGIIKAIPRAKGIPLSRSSDCELVRSR